MRLFRVSEVQRNPPNPNGIPKPLIHLRRYAYDMAYLGAAPPGETPKQLKRRIYDTQIILIRQETVPNQIRIHKKYPHVCWDRVWRNLHGAPINETLKATWYYIIHDIIPTNGRLHQIHLADSPNCARCGNEDTIRHRLTECQEAPVVWNTTRTLISKILRTDSRHIPASWTTTPDFTHWPNQKHGAVLWLLAHHVQYIVSAHTRLSMKEYMDFLKRARWKEHRNGRRPRPTGNYLLVLDDDTN
jgi:hypothetical protein